MGSCAICCLMTSRRVMWFRRPSAKPGKSFNAPPHRLLRGTRPKASALGIARGHTGRTGRARRAFEHQIAERDALYAAPSSPADDQSTPLVTSAERRVAQAGDATANMKRSILRRADAPTVAIPVLRMSAVKSSFTLADITDTDVFRKLGAALA